MKKNKGRGEKINRIAMILFAVIVIGGGIIGTEIEIARKREAQYIGSYPMANQHITWSYARIGGGK